ncbi:MAG: adenylyl-sulfate kinase [Candidatus Cloacimonetes bacterium]|nr:adenylyl-sulfate kinase [Candidatus Cloacimonadota bacterium]
MTHLKQLEAESIHIMREVIAEFENPAMLYSVGKDSSVMLHLAQKAFYPALPPFPLVHKELKKLDIPLERIDSKDIRELIPNVGFTREDRNRHMHRIGHLIKTLQNNSISTVASFVSPYRESRKAIRDMVKNNVIIYIKADIATCKARDYKGVYVKAMHGEYQNFTGINDVYEEPQYAEIVINTDELSVEEAVTTIINYVKKKYIR